MTKTSIPNSKLYFVFILLSSITLLSYVNNPPNGYTGAPGDSTCSSCHSGSSGGLDGSVSIAGLPSSIALNTTYTITVTVENLTTASKGGFQLVALDQSNNNIGMLSMAGASSTIQSNGSRDYFEHNPALSFGGPGTVTYTVNWKSPNIAGGQTITMYAASILTNGNGNSSGDLMVLNDISGTMPGPPPLTATITGFTNISCNGGNDGSITATPLNGLPPYEYLWSDGQTTPTAIGLTAKMYSVIVSDNLNATVTLTKLLTQPTLINIVSTGKKTLNCNGDKDGSINVNSSGGSGLHKYQWNTGVTTKIISNLSAGEYTVTVTDANNCMQSSIISITQPDLLIVKFKSTSNPVCINDASGFCDTEIEGGSPNYKYKWSSGETTSSISDKNIGTYTVTVTDAAGCTKSKSVSFIVSDVEKPVFKHWRDTISYRCNLVATTPIATDNCSIKEIKLIEGIKIGETYPIGITKMEYKAIDENGNETDYSFTVNIINPLKINLDTVAYDTCRGDINLLKLSLKNESNNFFDLYYNDMKIERFDTITKLDLKQFKFTDTLLSIKDSFLCTVDTLVKFDTLREKFSLLSFVIKDESTCKANDGSITLQLTGNPTSFKWLDEFGKETNNQSGKDLTAGIYYYVASSGQKNDTTACQLSFGPFEVKCTTSNIDNYTISPVAFPNPAKNELMVSWNSNSAIDLKIFNLNGKLVKHLDSYISKTIIPINDLENGIFIIQLNNRNRHQIIKLSIAR